MRLIGRAPSLLSLVAAAGLVVVACGSSVAPPTAEPTTTPTAPATAAPTATPSPTSRPTATTADQPVTGRIEVRDKGYAVTLPDNWFRIELDSDELDQLISAGSGQMSDAMATFMKSQVSSMITAGVSLYAMREADSKATVGTNVNILTLSSYGLTLDTLETLNVSQLKSLLGNDLKVDTDRLTLPAGDALQLAYEFSLTGDAGATFQILQYLIIMDRDQLVLSCSTPGEIAGIADECRSIANSIETLP